MPKVNTVALPVKWIQRPPTQPGPFSACGRLAPHASGAPGRLHRTIGRMVCRLCGAAAPEFQIAGTAYAECPDCSYIEVGPASLPLPEAEEKRYRLHHNSFDDEGYRHWITEFLDAMAPYLKPGAHVLDFGSGPEPVPARLLAERGFSVTVYDPYFATGDAWRKECWDAILVHEVAEHLFEPLATFKELAALLVPGGALCVRTRFPPAGDDGRLDRPGFSRWSYRMDPTHVGFFPEQSFRRLSTTLGLAITLLEPPDRVVMTKPR